MYHWKCLPVWFGLLSCMSTKSWQISRVPDRIACCSIMLWYPVWFKLPFTWWKSLTLRWAKAPRPRASSMLYGWSDTGGCSSFTKCSPHIDTSIWSKNFELWFISPEDFIPLCYCPVFARLSPLKLFDIVLLPQQRSVDNNFAIEASFTEHSSHNGCWNIFSRYLFKCIVIFGAVSLLSRKRVPVLHCFWSTNRIFCLVLSRFLMSPNSRIHCRPGDVHVLFMRITEEEKHIQIKFSKDISLYLGSNYWRRLVFSIINKNFVVLNLFH